MCAVQGRWHQRPLAACAKVGRECAVQPLQPCLPPCLFLSLLHKHTGHGGTSLQFANQPGRNTRVRRLMQRATTGPQPARSNSPWRLKTAKATSRTDSWRGKAQEHAGARMPGRWPPARLLLAACRSSCRLPPSAGLMPRVPADRTASPPLLLAAVARPQEPLLPPNCCYHRRQALLWQVPMLQALPLHLRAAAIGVGLAAAGCCSPVAASSGSCLAAAIGGGVRSSWLRRKLRWGCLLLCCLCCSRLLSGSPICAGTAAVRRSRSFSAPVLHSCSSLAAIAAACWGRSS